MLCLSIFLPFAQTSLVVMLITKTTGYSWSLPIGILRYRVAKEPSIFEKPGIWQ